MCLFPCASREAAVTDIIDKPITAGQLPPDLRGDLSPDTPVLLTVRQVTINGFTAAEEAAILAAEADVASIPYRAAKDVLADLRAVIDEA